MQTIERTTLSELVGNEQYARKVLPFIRGEYFADRTERIVFEEIQKFVEKYNALPTKSSLEIEIDSRRDLNEDDIRRVLTVVKELENDKDVNFEWLVETTEKFCKDKAVYNAIVEGIQIIDGKDKVERSRCNSNLFSQTPWLLVLIILLAMITCWTQTPDLSITIR